MEKSTEDFTQKFAFTSGVSVPAAETRLETGRDPRLLGLVSLFHPRSLGQDGRLVSHQVECSVFSEAVFSTRCSLRRGRSGFPHTLKASGLDGPQVNSVLLRRDVL
ncbi:unnamed protein product [Pleuronectes platessa]|uniref:Uncharacterized protein n=1 Tax=Pleuronectes platessa TaxID=8262 RepID=A0A9N7ZCF4_PLEPL|nr:unnamed protein product [Pleuronectes platessa]